MEPKGQTALSPANLPDETIGQWQGIVDLMAQLMDVPAAIITRAEPPLIEVFRASSNPANPYHAGLSAEMDGHYCERVICSAKGLRIVDARTDPDWQGAPEVDYGVISYLGFPVAWPDGRIFGTICVLDRKPNEYSDLHESLLSQFRNLIEAHLAMVLRAEQLEASLREINTLRGILPICAGCKSIRDDDGLWQQLESYVTAHSEAMFSHGLCPTCEARLTEDL